MMKRFAFYAMLLACQLSCSTDLTGIEDRLTQLEQQGQDLKNKGDKLSDENDKLKEGYDDAQGQLADLKDKLNSPELLSLTFLSSDNPLQLVEDTKCEILEGNLVECWVVNMMSDKKLIPHFEFKGESVTMNGQAVESGVSVVDFTKPVTLTVNGIEKSISYTVYVHSFTGLPTLWIETSRRAEIEQVNWNYKASFKLVEDVKTRAAGDVISKIVDIKVVPPFNTYFSELSHKNEIDKNNYIITFNESMSLFGEKSNNDFELFSNRDDRSMLRNQTGYFMGSLSNLEFTPKFHFVELMLNGLYYGTYMIGDFIETSQSRVNVPIDGYLLKIDEKNSGVRVVVPNVEQPVSILSPSMITGDDKYIYIQNYLHETADALFSSDFTSTITGWQKYMDIESFVDWYLINEILKNEDAAFQKDCYMYMNKEGKLKMGPLWNFATSFGNGKDSSESGFVVKSAKWFNRLFEDPAFVEKVKERFDYFYSHKGDIIMEMNENASYLKYSVQENNNKWLLYDTSNTSLDSWILYQNEIDAMKLWLEKRMTWLKTAISQL